MNWCYKDDTWCYVTREFMKDNVASFTCKNYKKAQAVRMQLWWASKLPDELKYYEKINDNLYRIPYWWSSFKPNDFEDRRKKPLLYERIFIWELRDEQKKAISKLTESPIWLLEASTGVWKWVMIPYLVSELKLKTLIVVPWIQLLNEMVDRLQKHCWFVPTTVWWKKQWKKVEKNESVVLTTIDSACSMSKELVQSFDCVLMDECDKYVTTDNRIKFLMSLAPRYLYWFTGTLQLNFIDSKVFKIFFWKQSQLKSLNFKPQCFYIKTDFVYSEWELEDTKEFTILNNEVTCDHNRNNLIVQTVSETLPACETRKWLILTNRIEHATILKEQLDERWIESFIIVWDTEKKERDKIIEYVRNTNNTCVIIWSASILWRWFDLPPLQIVYITYPNKFEANVIQSCWRVMRKSEWKTYCQVYDFVDNNVWILKRHWVMRHRSMKNEYKLDSVIQYIPWESNL